MKRWDAAADERRFRDDVKTGDRWVRRIAARLEQYQLWAVTVPAVQVRPTFAERHDFEDRGDLFLNGHRVEVRSFGFRFTDASDFPRRSVQVELASVIAAKKNAVAYFFVSRATGAAVALYGPELRDLALQVGVWNARRQVARDWMTAPACRLQSFERAVQFLAERCRVPVPA